MVSLVVPCRNERDRIQACLDSLRVSEYPAGRLEILVIDGMSDDGTRDLLGACVRADPSIRVFDNPRRITPSALNIGVANARGSVLMLVGAHAEFPATYVRDLVTWLEWSGAEGVGGRCETVPGDDTTMACAIALALAHPFGVGDSWFRIGTDEPRWVDTVPFGCYRRDLFSRIGGFDEDLVRNQDEEFNYRVLRRGGRLLLVPHVVSRYYARTRLPVVARMFYQYGLFKPLVIRKVGRVMTLRQLAPATFASVLAMAAVLAPWLPGRAALMVGLVSVYTTVAMIASVPGGRRYGVRCLLAMLLVFPAIHVSYGLGFLAGLVRLVRPAPGAAAAVPLSR